MSSVSTSFESIDLHQLTAVTGGNGDNANPMPKPPQPALFERIATAGLDGGKKGYEVSKEVAPYTAAGATLATGGNPVAAAATYLSTIMNGTLVGTGLGVGGQILKEVGLR